MKGVIYKTLLEYSKSRQKNDEKKENQPEKMNDRKIKGRVNDY